MEHAMAGHVAIGWLEIRSFQLKFYCERLFGVGRPAEAATEWRNASFVPGRPTVKSKAERVTCSGARESLGPDQRGVQVQGN
jgi:hypothetical protein